MPVLALDQGAGRLSLVKLGCTKRVQDLHLCVQGAAHLAGVAVGHGGERPCCGAVLASIGGVLTEVRNLLLKVCLGWGRPR
jgi:hypothetical protein